MDGSRVVAVAYLQLLFLVRLVVVGSEGEEERGGEERLPLLWS